MEFLFSIWQLLGIVGAGISLTSITVFSLTKLFVEKTIEEKIRFEYAKLLELYKEELSIRKDEIQKRNSTIEELNYYREKSLRLIRQIVDGRLFPIDEVQSELMQIVKNIEELLARNDYNLQKIDLKTQFHRYKSNVYAINSKFKGGFQDEYRSELEGSVAYQDLLESNQIIIHSTYNEAFQLGKSIEDYNSQSITR